MSKVSAFSREALRLDAARVCDELVAELRQDVTEVLRKPGAAVGVSGGVDSSVVLALCVRAFTTQHVVAVLMPDRESTTDSVPLALRLTQQFGVTATVEDITAALEGFGCYARRDAAVRRLFPDYTPQHRCKIGLPADLLERDSLNVFTLTVVAPDGSEQSKRLPPREFREIVAATNMKQRTRMIYLYYHAERRNYAVVGTANKDEYGQGFFVKYGDGGVDVKPIGHLYKTQVYQLADHLGIPEPIRTRTPTTDTYSAAVSQQEFFFRVPFEIMDLIWFGLEHGVPTEEVAEALDLTTEQVLRVQRDLQQKQMTTAYLRTRPLGVA